jgi:hypothetical protein
MLNQPTIIDPLMREAFDKFQRVYQAIHLERTGKAVSPCVEACDFLAEYTLMSGSGALLLAANGLIRPAAALTRTCIESQACARYIFTFPPAMRDAKAAEFLTLRSVCRALYGERCLDKSKPRIAAVINSFDPAQQKKLREIVEAELAAGGGVSLRTRFNELKRKWNFNEMVEMENLRQELPGVKLQESDPLLKNEYARYCYFVHPNPVATVFEPHIPPDHICQTVLLAAMNAVGVLMQLLDVSSPEFVQAGEAFIAKYSKISK